MSKAIKAPVPSADLISAALAVFTARAGVETLRPVIEKIKSDILEKHEFIFVNRFAVAYPTRFTDEDRQPRRLTDFEDATELPEEESKRLFDILEAEYVKAGFTEDRPDGHCPLLILERLEREATDLFISMSQEINPVFDIKILEIASYSKRQKYTETMLGLVAKYIKPADNPFQN